MVSRSHIKISGNDSQFKHGTEYGAEVVTDKWAFELTGARNCFSGDKAIAHSMQRWLGLSPFAKEKSRVSA